MAEKFHMIDYIYEGPQALEATISHNEKNLVDFVEKCKQHPIEKIIITGLGSSFAAALMAEPLFRMACPIPVLLVNGEEAGYYKSAWIGESSLVVSISRSGERGSIVDIQKDVKEQGGLGLAVTSRADNLLSQYAGAALITQEGPEISFPKTKSVMACTGVLMRLALEFGDKKNPNVQTWLNGLRRMPEIIQRNILLLDDFIQGILPEISQHAMLNAVGTGSNYGLALDAAVKVQESSFVPTRGDSTAGLLHGPVGALNARCLVLAMVTAYDLEVSRELLEQIHTFKAYSICVQDPQIKIEAPCTYAISLSESVDVYQAALAYMPAVQLLAYHWTVARGMNPDKPASMDSLMDAFLPEGRQEAEFQDE